MPKFLERFKEDGTIFEAKLKLEEIRQFESVKEIRMLDRKGNLRLTFIKESPSESSIKTEVKE